MPVRKIQVGQVWRMEGTGDDYLVTKLYTEALATFVILRKAGSETENKVRVRVERVPDGQNIPGFAYAQEADQF
jgi:hypothetical protein